MQNTVIERIVTNILMLDVGWIQTNIQRFLVAALLSTWMSRGK